MEQFSLFDPAHAGDLVVVEKRIPYQVFTLTDGLRSYGELSYPNGRDRIITTAQGSWTYSAGKYFHMDILINDGSTGQTIATLKTSFWLARITLQFADGQTFKFIRPTVFTKISRWRNEEFGDILTIDCRLFSMKQDFKVIPEQSAFKNNEYSLLMIFLSVHIILMRRVYAGAMQD